MDNTIERFSKAEEAWQGTHCTVNPVSYMQQLNDTRVSNGEKQLSDNDPADRVKILQHTVSLMVLCDEVLMLRGWQESEGATLERNIAVLMGKRIHYEE